jgi:hypothetical protein
LESQKADWQLPKSALPKITPAKAAKIFVAPSGLKFVRDTKKVRSITLLTLFFNETGLLDN